jgi:hypothetical protein
MKRKFLNILFSLSVAIVFTSCDKENLGDNYDFSNTLSPYVEFRSLSSQNVIRGNNSTFTFQLRSGLQEDVIVTYSITGVINSPNRRTLINRNNLGVDVAFPIPSDTPVGTATVTLNSAVTESGKSLTIGPKNIASEQKFNINVTAAP